MTVVELVILLIVAGVCGAIGQSLGGYSGIGCIASVALGFIGALLGTWLAGAIGLPELFVLDIGGQPFPIIWSIVGAALFVAVLGLFRRAAI
jgi:uncharacterized membrane protein YeaQ/YmgE (transglycosylase-associated protein family)